MSVVSITPVDFNTFLKFFVEIIFATSKTLREMSKYVVFSGQYSCIQSEYRKIRTRENSVFGHFSRSESLWKYNYLINFFSWNISLLLTKIISNCLPTCSLFTATKINGKKISYKINLLIKSIFYNSLNKKASDR